MDNEKNNDTKTPREVVNNHKYDPLHNNYNPSIKDAGLEKALEKKDREMPNLVNHNLDVDNDIDIEEETDRSATRDDNIETDSEMHIDSAEVRAEEQNTNVKVTGEVFGLSSQTKIILIAVISFVVFFFLILVIALAFLSKNSDNLNYATSYVESDEYTKIYNEVEKVVTLYKSRYGVTVDKYLILSALTAYQGNEVYEDDTESDMYDDISVDTEETDIEGNVTIETKTVSKMQNYIEILAKYQIKTTMSCSMDSSSMRKIASNDDDVSIFNFLSSAAAREKNYDCSGSSSDMDYSLSIDEGNIDDENSGSTFYWNLIDEDFLKEYYAEYFADLSGDVYEQTAAETVEYIYLYAQTLENYDTTGTTTGTCNGTYFWWPIGSSETTTENGVTMASGDPVATTITATFAGNDSVHNGSHGALDIAAGGDVNIIAAKAGTVVYPTDKETQTNYGVGYYGSNDGGGYGNYVIIEHSDGTYTLYGHMLGGSITVEAGDTVRQGQVIGKMGSSGNSTGQHLHFEVRVGGNDRKYKVDPEDYVSQDDPRPGCSDFSLTTTSLTETEFVTLMNNYCTSSGNSNFCNNFASNAELIYETSIDSNVNPELVVVTAGTESSWNDNYNGKTYKYNYWGINMPNGSSSGSSYSSFEAGIKGYASAISKYLEGGSLAGSIMSRYNERLEAGCDSAGYGLPGTLAGMQSVYSWVGTYRYNPGSYSLGGCRYLNIIYGSGYCSTVTTCTDYSNCSSASATTVCEQNDYTVWQLSKKIELRNDIFGL